MITVSQPSCTSSRWLWLFRVSASFAPPCASDSPTTPERAEPIQRRNECAARATADQQWQGETGSGAARPRPSDCQTRSQRLSMRFCYRRFHGVFRSSQLVQHAARCGWKIMARRCGRQCVAHCPVQGFGFGWPSHRTVLRQRRHCHCAEAFGRRYPSTAACVR